MDVLLLGVVKEGYLATGIPMIKITRCPTCGSKRIDKVRRDWFGSFQGKSYAVPALEFHQCPDCGEELYDRVAMRRIESSSPAYANRRRQKKSA